MKELANLRRLGPGDTTWLCERRRYDRPVHCAARVACCAVDAPCWPPQPARQAAGSGSAAPRTRPRVMNSCRRWAPPVAPAGYNVVGHVFCR